jgi:prepilin-type N-terminal cleavage/methylation domain-containing protein
MRLHRAPVRRRDGFTLIELLVVMSIIAILASLTTAAVFKAFEKMWEVQTRNDISSLASSVKQFESDYNMTVPPPSRIWLDKQGTYATPPVGYSAAQMGSLTQLGIDSKAYLTRVWPRIWQSGVVVDWNGDGSANEGFVLEGEQVLVFFLGGARNATGSFIGFSADPTNPMNTNAAIKRKGPYFTFDNSRITAGPGGAGAFFPMYLDGYTWKGVGKPYAYFSCGGRGANGYCPYAGNAVLGASDCPSLIGVSATGTSAALLPYNQPIAAGQPTVFYNPDTFQIISAGKNQVFGPGGSWTGASSTAIGAAGIDDLTNFASSKLGVPQ